MFSVNNNVYFTLLNFYWKNLETTFQGVSAVGFRQIYFL